MKYRIVFSKMILNDIIIDAERMGKNEKSNNYKMKSEEI